MKILVTSRSFGSGKNDYSAQLAALGHQVVSGSPNHDLEALTADLADTDAWIAGTGPVTGAHLDRAPALKVIARYGVGVDAVELDAAAARGIVVTNTPGANSGAVADHTVALLLAAARQVAEGDRRVRRGDWRAIRGRELVVYLSCEGAPQQALLARLGKHRMTVSCLYFKRLDDLDRAVLEQLVAGSIAETRARYG